MVQTLHLSNFFGENDEQEFKEHILMGTRFCVKSTKNHVSLPYIHSSYFIAMF